MPNRRIAALCILVLAAFGCDSAEPEGGDGGADAGLVDSSTPSDAPTYYGDVRPIVVDNCQMCHVEGGIAPFALETYQQAFEVGERMAQVTHDRIMPPYLADTSGDCRTFANDRTLTQAEIDTIGQWYEGGRLEGDPTTPMPDAPPVLHLPRTDTALEMPEVYTVNSSLDDDYRCFVVESTTTETTFVTGYEVIPGNTERVHHVIVYNPVSEAQAQAARDLDAAEGGTGSGFTCFGGPRVDAPPLAIWAPGTGATLYPRGTGIELVAGRAQVVQVHYNNLVAGDVSTEDRTQIKLMTADTANQAYLFPIINGGISLPPRMESVTQSYTQSLSMLPVQLRAWGMFPHMHTLGRQLRVVLNGTTDQCMINVPRWDFNWQLAYWYDSPVPISPTDSVTISCTYNTMSRDETVTWGDGTQDEMCLSFVYVTL